MKVKESHNMFKRVQRTILQVQIAGERRKMRMGEQDQLLADEIQDAVLEKKWNNYKTNV